MLKIAVGKMDITPDEPVRLMGYNTRIGLSKGVLDKIWVMTVILNIGDDKICMLTYDSVGLHKKLTDKIRKRISEQFDIPFDNILASFTHTHSAPSALSMEDTNADPDNDFPVLPGYLNLLEEQSVKAVEAAYAKGFEEASTVMVKGMIDGYYSNRNNKNAPSDKSVNILKFVNPAGRVIAAIVNLTCHSTVLGPDSNLISGDLHGYVRDVLQREWDTFVLMSNGAAGDMSNRQYRQGNTAEELKRVGDGVSKLILSFKHETPIDTGNNIKVIKNFYSLKYTPDNEAVQKMLADIEQRLETETDYDTIKLYKSVLGFKNMRMGDVDMVLDSYTYQFGDVTIVTIPGELFSRLGLKIKNVSKSPYTIIWGYNNQLCGYFVEESEFGKYFESFVTSIPKGVPEKFTRQIISNLNVK